jgi:hypothetical protein
MAMFYGKKKVFVLFQHKNIFKLKYLNKVRTYSQVQKISNLFSSNWLDISFGVSI